STCGRSSFSANSRTVARTSRCSSERSKSAIRSRGFDTASSGARQHTRCALRTQVGSPTFPTPRPATEARREEGEAAAASQSPQERSPPRPAQGEAPPRAAEQEQGRAQELSVAFGVSDEPRTLPAVPLRARGQERRRACRCVLDAARTV